MYNMVEYDVNIIVLTPSSGECAPTIGLASSIVRRRLAAQIPCKLGHRTHWTIVSFYFISQAFSAQNIGALVRPFTQQVHGKKPPSPLKHRWKTHIYMYTHIYIYIYRYMGMYMYISHFFVWTKKIRTGFYLRMDAVDVHYDYDADSLRLFVQVLLVFSIVSYVEIKTKHTL